MFRCRPLRREVQHGTLRRGAHRFQPDAAALAFDNGAPDCQSQPHPVLLGAEERIKQLGQVFNRNAETVGCRAIVPTPSIVNSHAYWTKGSSCAVA
jgi:hypothetical protein